MGMYTEFHFNSSIKKDCPDDVITILKFMTGQVDDFFDELVPDHKLFSTRAWSYMLRSDSYYFDAVTESKLHFDEMTKQYTICIRCNLKNYDSEIEKFIDWISPYLEKFDGEFLGFWRYEEFEEPELIYYHVKDSDKEE